MTSYCSRCGSRLVHGAPCLFCRLERLKEKKTLYRSFGHSSWLEKLVLMALVIACCESSLCLFLLARMMWSML